MPRWPQKSEDAPMPRDIKATQGDVEAAEKRQDFVNRLDEAFSEQAGTPALTLPAEESEDSDFFSEEFDQDAIRAKIDAAKNELLAEYAEEQLDYQARRRAAKAEGRTLPPLESVLQRDFGVDASRMVTSDGKPAGTPGYEKRHVRLVDIRERESSARIGEKMSEGFRFIKDPDTGKPMVGEFGAWMERDPGTAARVLAAKESRVMDLNSYAKTTFQQTEEAIARKSDGKKRVRFFTPDAEDEPAGIAA